MSTCASIRKSHVSDRAKRYRANQKGCLPSGPRRCALCKSRHQLMVDHKDGDESNGRNTNLRWLCRSCNTRLGARMAKKGKGRRTVQFNPRNLTKEGGASNLFEYVLAGTQHTRGAHDAGGKIIHNTPKSKRREFAAEIWAKRSAGQSARGKSYPDEPDWVTNPIKATLNGVPVTVRVKRGEIQISLRGSLQ